MQDCYNVTFLGLRQAEKEMQMGWKEISDIVNLYVIKQ